VKIPVQCLTRTASLGLLSALCRARERGQGYSPGYADTPPPPNGGQGSTKVDTVVRKRLQARLLSLLVVRVP
jgi:hypothetical protein